MAVATQGAPLLPTALLTTAPKWTRQDYMQVWLNIFIKFGDSVQIYLPMVITQIVSCEMGVSRSHERMLGVALYVTLMATTPVAALISNRYSSDS